MLGTECRGPGQKLQGDLFKVRDHSGLAQKMVMVEVGRSDQIVDLFQDLPMNWRGRGEERKREASEKIPRTVC